MWKFVGLLLLFPLTASAVTYYVDPATGNNANAGTSTGSPWRNPPGTRNAGNSAFDSSAWGSINGTTKIACGDTILLKGGSTQTSSQGGAWCFTSAAGGAGTCRVTSYYNSCASNPITVRVATAAEWAGSSGNFTLNGSGITAASGQFIGDVNGLVVADGMVGLTLSGASDTQRLRIINGSDCCMVSTGNTDTFVVDWTTIQTCADRGFAIGNTVRWRLDHADISGASAHGIDMGLHLDWQTDLGGVLNTKVHDSGSGGSVPFNSDGIYFVATRRVWMLNSEVYNHQSNGMNGGSVRTTGNPQSTTYRASIRNSRIYNNGLYDVTQCNGCIAGSGTDWGGDGDTAAPHSYAFLFYDLWYGNKGVGLYAPHDSGRMYAWNQTAFANGWDPSQYMFHVDLAHDRTSDEFEARNIIAQRSYVNRPAWGTNQANQFFAPRPVMNNNLWDFGTSGTELFSTWTWPGGYSGSGTSYNSAVASGFPIGPQDRLSTDTTRYRARFISTGGNCNTATRNLADCDFRLCTGVNQPIAGCAGASDAIDAGAYFLRANGAGTNATTITVKKGDPTSSSDAELADPRNFFIEPTTFPGAVADTIMIQGTGGPCTVTVQSMTANSITFTPACSWSDNAGIHLPWNGNGPDIGAFESGGVVATTTSTVPVPTTTSTTTTTLPGTATSLFSALLPASTGPTVDPAGPVELGVKFGSTVPGNITAIRFYKATGNTGTHVGNLWDINGNRLTTVTFANETAGGWQEQALPVPIHINANTTYVVSYFAPIGAWSYTQDFLATRFWNSPLYALGQNESPNGVYAYAATSTFPTTNWSGTHYFADVVFAADTNPPTTSVTSLPATTVTSTTAPTTTTVTVTTTTSTSTTSLPGPFKGSGIGGGSISRGPKRRRVLLARGH